MITQVNTQNLFHAMKVLLARQLMRIFCGKIWSINPVPPCKEKLCHVTFVFWSQTNNPNEISDVLNSYGDIGLSLNDGPILTQ